MNQIYCPNIHRLLSLATPPVEHMVHNPGIPACYCEPIRDHSLHPVPRSGKLKMKIRNSIMLLGNKGLKAKPMGKQEKNHKKQPS